MTAMDGPETSDLVSELQDIDDSEWTFHGDFISRNVETVKDVLLGELVADTGRLPVGCPRATPEALSRKRSSADTSKYPCSFENIENIHSQESPGCVCDDPLCGSTSIIDSFAAVAIAPDDRPPERRYFDHYWREVIARLRDEVGSWNTIDGIPEPGIHDTLEKCADGRGINQKRVKRLLNFLSAIDDYERTEGISLSDLPNLPYDTLADEFATFPGISTSDAYWLLLTTFEKPIWPASPEIDRTLACLGLLEPETIDNGANRRTGLEEQLPERLLPVLHRAIAGHTAGCSHRCFEEPCDLQKFTLPYRQDRQRSRPDDRPVAVDLFSGAGGLSLGFKQAGFSVRYAVDVDRDATDTYRLNHPEIPHEHVATEDIGNHVETGSFDDLEFDVDAVIGGPPCQAISIAGYRSRRADDDDYSVLEDKRATLYQEYISAINSLDPKIILMENVEGIISKVADSEIRIADLVLDSLADIGYRAEYRLVDCSNFGIPQNRHRVFIVGVRKSDETLSTSVSDIFDKVFGKSSETDYTIRQGLAGLPHLGRGEGGRVTVGKERGRRGEYVTQNGLDSDSRLLFNHRAREHPHPRDRRIFDEALEPGKDSWDIVQESEYDHLIEYDIGTEDNPRFKDKYRMLDWESQSPTIVAHLEKDSNSFVLPDYHRYYSHTQNNPEDSRNRGLTPREAARLQSFPDDYLFLGPFTSWFVQIGNAVPPVVARQVGDVLHSVIAGKSPGEESRSIQSVTPAESDD